MSRVSLCLQDRVLSAPPVWFSVQSYGGSHFLGKRTLSLPCPRYSPLVLAPNLRTFSSSYFLQKDEERKRAAKAPRLDGAKVTDLGRPREPPPPPPAAFAAPSTGSASLRRDSQPSGRSKGERSNAPDDRSTRIGGASATPSRYTVAPVSSSSGSSSKKLQKSGGSSGPARDVGITPRRSGNPTDNPSLNSGTRTSRSKESNTARCTVTRERGSSKGHKPRQSAASERPSAKASSSTSKRSSSAGGVSGREVSDRRVGRGNGASGSGGSGSGGGGASARDGGASRPTTSSNASAYKTPKVPGGKNVAGLGNSARGGSADPQRRTSNTLGRSAGGDERQTSRLAARGTARKPGEGLGGRSRADMNSSKPSESRATGASVKPGVAGGRSVRVAARKKKSAASSGGGVAGLLGSILKDIDDTHTKK